MMYARELHYNNNNNNNNYNITIVKFSVVRRRVW